eukprot:CAMPEP_0119322612 /NCGR_PEP_ID=MMETSP1333-20130426/58698_1 /TAXON_ID=418940 /ORGANISM="Scyphosphaera apsteinii, Strain RCC1455" /LENGTH=48 /DNA_ID= /DNA_START= /DNA_END= /DNA_ORIENTATION=
MKTIRVQGRRVPGWAEGWAAVLREVLRNVGHVLLLVAQRSDIVGEGRA